MSPTKRHSRERGKRHGVDKETGIDTQGCSYPSVEVMWTCALGGDTLASTPSPGGGGRDNDSDEEGRTGRGGWYGKAIHYWQTVDATVDGMLGGISQVSHPDLRDSELFLIRHWRTPPGSRKQGTIALDVGSGIGRITKGLLVRLFDRVDLCEQNPTFLGAAREFIASEKVERLICSGLQDFVPEPQRYDVIWAQWVLAYLPDDDLVALLMRCKDGLAPGGLIFVKENVTKKGFVLDKDDNSVTRSHAMFMYIFERARLSVVDVEVQRNFPRGLFGVRMYCLRPL